MLERPIEQYPALRRYLAQGLRHNPLRDAPKFGFVCLENARQCLFVEPNTGYFRAGRTLRVEGT